jgi:hypothetical protein
LYDDRRASLKFTSLRVGFGGIYGIKEKGSLKHGER